MEENLKRDVLDTPLGRMSADTSGATVGVLRVDPGKPYSEVGALLETFLKSGDEGAWGRIASGIDYLFENLDLVMKPLDVETGFCGQIRSRMDQGRKLLIKPNLVSPYNIDPQTYGPGTGSTACTEWAFVAALMRWFHDRQGISYHQMALGEASTTTSAAAGAMTVLNGGTPVTPEAVIEGRWNGSYGGWGFYFARKYLSERLEPGRRDDPMRGYEESVSGTYFPPGLAKDRLMVYDLNRICDDPGKGREVAVPDGVNYRSIILHKAVVGGDPEDQDDMRAYPGCVLVNVPKLKVHNITLFTNAIKNLGIGLYPMQASNNGGTRWKYACPDDAIPGMKGGIPHQVWVPELDAETGMARRDAGGRYIVRRTGGILATMVDIIKAVVEQGVYMVHVVDAIEPVNLDHTGSGNGMKEPEGMVFAGVDPVATDLLCARYLFSNVPLEEAVKASRARGQDGLFLQRVPKAAVQDGQIVTREGYDCPLARDISFEYAEKRGLGRRHYYVVGRDAIEGHPLISVRGHLGKDVGGAFSEVQTKALYWDIMKMPWDLQKTTFSYLEAVDQLTGSSLKRDFLDAFDEDGDGVVGYEEFGRKGALGPAMLYGGLAVSLGGREPLGYLRGAFIARALQLKYSNPDWNTEGHDLFAESAYGGAAVVAYRMSQMPTEAEDPFVPGLRWGGGKWPSFRTASFMRIGIALFGPMFPIGMGFPSLYGFAFRYADLTQNNGGFTGEHRNQPDPGSIQRYARDLESGRIRPLDFILYLPAGYAKAGGSAVPNVEETADPQKLFTAVFESGKEVWPGERLPL